MQGEFVRPLYDDRPIWWMSTVCTSTEPNALVCPKEPEAQPSATMQAVISRPLQHFLAYVEGHRRQVFAIAAVLFAIILFTDWKIILDRSMGFLYILPILLVAAFLSNYQVVLLSAVCALLREQFTPGDWGPGAWYRIVTGFSGFLLAGVIVSALNRERRLVVEQLALRDEEMRLRREADQQTRVLIETSPLAILILDNTGLVVLANQSAHDLLACSPRELQGSDVGALLPILTRLTRTAPTRTDFRTALECKGHRKNGEVFLAHIWLSTYSTVSGLRLAAVVWDASENLRDREGTGLDSMMSVSRVLVGAVSHEIRNLAAAGLAAYQRLGEQPAVETTEPFLALGATLRGLEKIASSGLTAASRKTAEVTDLGTVLDETRIVVEDSIRDMGGTVIWDIAPGLPLVSADQHSLLQVFLNLARNSERAMRTSPRKELRVEARHEGDLVMVRFRDTGPGVPHVERLFEPFQAGANSTGLGLYISRAILRANGGDLRHEPQEHGCCFAVELWPSEDGETT